MLMVLEETITGTKINVIYIFIIFFITKIYFRHITMPNGSRRDHFLHWIENLSGIQSPSWLGLPNNAEKVLLTTRGIF